VPPLDEARGDLLDGAADRLRLVHAALPLAVAAAHQALALEAAGDVAVLVVRVGVVEDQGGDVGRRVRGEGAQVLGAVDLVVGVAQPTQSSRRAGAARRRGARRRSR
jgi:hypothetical protein